MSKNTNVYIDGFNFYYGCVKSTPYKWLDFERLCNLLLTDNNIMSIKYLTARVNLRPSDNDQTTRQETYFRALRTLPKVQIILGHFLTNVVSLPLANGSGFVNVLRTEEKGSDVNLATHLVNDAHNGEIECAVVVSNDSDLAEPMRIVGSELGLLVGLISPTTNNGRHPSRQLTQHASFIKSVRKSALVNSQFPTELQDSNGNFRKPLSW